MTVTIRDDDALTAGFAVTADRSMWLNESGWTIWDCCDGSRNVEEIGALLADRFDAGDRDLTDDVLAVVQQFHAAGFVEIA